MLELLQTPRLEERLRAFSVLAAEGWLSEPQVPSAECTWTQVNFLPYFYSLPLNEADWLDSHVTADTAVEARCSFLWAIDSSESLSEQED